MKRLPFLFNFLSGLLLLAAGDAHAVLLIGNLGAAPTAGGGFVGTNGTGIFIEREVSFIMPSQGYTLDNVVLALLDSPNTAVPGMPLVSIWTDDGAGKPGSSLAVLGGGPATIPEGSGVMDYTFTPASQVDLLANQTYHLVLSDSASGLYSWNNSVNVDPSGIAAFGNYRLATDGDPYGDPLLARSRFDINATAVPEPSRAVLSLAGIVAIGLLRRRC